MKKINCNILYALLLTVLACKSTIGKHDMFNRNQIGKKAKQPFSLYNQQPHPSQRNDNQYLDATQNHEKDDQKDEKDNDTEYIKNIKPQAQAMACAKNINQGLENGDRGQVLKGLQLLALVDMNKISNPRIVMEKILDAITGKAVQWENYGIKRKIARQLRAFVHRMYKISKQERKGVHKDDKKAILEKIDYSLDQIDESNSPGNGLRFELDVVRAMVDALPDTSSFWDTWGESVMDLFEACSDKNSLKLKTLATTIYDELKTKYNKGWYEIVLYIDYLKEEAKGDAEALDRLQDLLYEYKTKRKFQKLNALNPSGNWHILYVGIDALTYIIQNTKDKKIEKAAFQNKTKQKPGLVYYLEFNSIKTLGIKKNNWRIREKAVESMIQLSRHNNRKIIKTVGQYLFDRKIKEEDDRVKLLIDHPEYITVIEETLKRDWTTYKTGFEKLLSQHKQEMTEVFKKLWDKERGNYESSIKQQNELLGEIKKNLLEEENEIKDFIEDNNEELLKLVSDRLSILEEKIAQGNDTNPTEATNEDEKTEVEVEAEAETENVSLMAKEIATLQKQIQILKEEGEDSDMNKN